MAISLLPFPSNCFWNLYENSSLALSEIGVLFNKVWSTFSPTFPCLFALFFQRFPALVFSMFQLIYMYICKCWSIWVVHIKGDPLYSIVSSTLSPPPPTPTYPSHPCAIIPSFPFYLFIASHHVSYDDLNFFFFNCMSCFIWRKYYVSYYRDVNRDNLLDFWSIYLVI